MATSLSSSVLVLREEKSRRRNKQLLYDVERVRAALIPVSTERLELLKQHYLECVASEWLARQQQQELSPNDSHPDRSRSVTPQSPAHSDSSTHHSPSPSSTHGSKDRHSIPSSHHLTPSSALHSNGAHHSPPSSSSTSSSSGPDLMQSNCSTPLHQLSSPPPQAGGNTSSVMYPGQVGIDSDGDTTSSSSSHLVSLLEEEKLKSSSPLLPTSPPLSTAPKDEAQLGVLPQLSRPDPVLAAPPPLSPTPPLTTVAAVGSSSSLSEPSEVVKGKKEEEEKRENDSETEEDKEGEKLKEDDMEEKEEEEGEEEEEENVKVVSKLDHKHAEIVPNDTEEWLNAELSSSPAHGPNSRDEEEEKVEEENKEEEEKEEEEEVEEEEEEEVEEEEEEKIVCKVETEAGEDQLNSKEHLRVDGAGEKANGVGRDSAVLREEGRGGMMDEEEGPSSTSQDLSESDDFWGDGAPSHSTPMPAPGITADKESGERDPPSHPRQDHCAVVCYLLQSINYRLRSDREEAKYLYSDPSPTDSMKGMIVKSKVVNSLLTRGSGTGSELASWDSRAVASVLEGELREMVKSHGALLVTESSGQTLEEFSECLKDPWREVWPLLLEHARLVFQCGQPLDRVAAALAPMLGGVGTKETLLKLLEASCGVEDSLPLQPPLSSLSPSGDNTSPSSSSSSSSSSSILSEGKPDEAAPVTESAAYRALLLHSSLVSEGDSSISEGSAVEAVGQLSKASSSLPSMQWNQANGSGDDGSSCSASGISSPSFVNGGAQQSEAGADRASLMKRMGLLQVSETDSELELPTFTAEDVEDDFDFYS